MFGLVWKSQTLLTSFQGREIGKSTLFCKVRYVLYSDINIPFLQSELGKSLWTWTNDVLMCSPSSFRKCAPKPLIQHEEHLTRVG